MRYAVLLSVLLAAVCSHSATSAQEVKDQPDKKKLAEFIEQYTLTPFENRGKHVTDKKEFEAGWKSYYKGVPPVDSASATVTKVASTHKPGVFAVSYTLKVKADDQPATIRDTVYVRADKEGMKMEWSANVGYNPQSHTVWAAGNDIECTFRVTAKLSDYFNFQYAGVKQTAYSIKMDLGHPSGNFYAYVQKDTPLGKRMHELLKDGDSCNITVTVFRTGKETSVVTLKSLDSESWLK